MAPDAAAERFPTSELAGRYRLTRRLGSGGWADVFAAEDRVLHRQVAVKLFRFDAPVEDVRARIEVEIRTLARLRHPGLVVVYDAGTVPMDGGEATPFVVMELVAGPTLHAHLADGPLATAEALALGRQLAITLAYVHAQGVVHRDVKPANILLDPDPDHAPRERAAAPLVAKLADFGTARLVESARLTLAGTLIGTPNYVSPEQVTGEPVGPASDVYSLGLVLLECLTATAAFPGDGLAAATARLHRQPPIPPWIPGEVGEVIRAMVVRDPAERPTAADVAARLGASTAATANGFGGGGHGAARRDAEGNGTPIGAAATAVIAGPVPAGGTAVLEVPAAPAAVAAPVDRHWDANPAEWPAADRPLRWNRRHWLLIAIALAVVVLLGALIMATRRAGVSVGPAPAYPPVTGQLGRDLDHLQGVIG